MPAGRPDPGFGDEELDGPGDLAEPGDDETGYDPYPYQQATAGSADQPAGEVVGSGPWDSSERYNARERVDLGSLLIPVNPEQQVRLDLDGDQIVAASVAHGDSTLQVQAFAAPKTGGLWDDARGDIAAEIGKLGGEPQEAQGPFGTELRGRVPADPSSGNTGLEPARFFGVDGPRWLLRGKIRGEAADRPELARPLEEVFADIVVVRGDHPAPPRDLLEIQLPVEMRQAIAEEIAQAEQAEQAEQRRQYPSPFERGPEITETR
jgi:hypothetical protein